MGAYLSISTGTDSAKTKKGNSVITAGRSVSISTFGSERVVIKNGAIDIATQNPDNIKINGSRYVPCAELADLLNSVKDEKFKTVYNKHCNKN